MILIYYTTDFMFLLDLSPFTPFTYPHLPLGFYWTYPHLPYISLMIYRLATPLCKQ